MLLTTSRKPSQRTRSFSQRLSRIMGWRYINRGKMSLRDVLIEARGPVAVVSERHGNPARITFLDERGGERGYILFNPAFEMKKPELSDKAVRVSTCPPGSEGLCNLMGLEVDESSSRDAWSIRTDEEYAWVMELLDARGTPAGFKLLIRDFRVGE